MFLETEKKAPKRSCSVAECAGKYYLKGYCQKHYQRMKRRGSTADVKGSHGSAQQRMDYYTDKSGGCWIFNGPRVPGGYGDLSMNSRHNRAHRVAYELAYGPIPEGLLVRHKCNNPPCVRPDHLEVGTYFDNRMDCVRSGRTLHSENHPNAKLKPADVRLIRSRYKAGGVSLSALGRLFGVSLTTIHRIVNRQRWQYLPESEALFVINS